jgi:hypothetical protein
MEIGSAVVAAVTGALEAATLGDPPAAGAELPPPPSTSELHALLRRPDAYAPWQLRHLGAVPSDSRAG